MANNHIIPKNNKLNPYFVSVFCVEILTQSDILVKKDHVKSIFKYMWKWSNCVLIFNGGAPKPHANLPLPSLDRPLCCHYNKNVILMRGPSRDLT